MAIDAMLGNLPFQTLGIWGVFGVVLVSLIRGWPILKRIKAEQDGSLISQLFERTKKLEADLAKQREECGAEQAEMRSKISTLYGIINGLRRQILTYQLKLGEAIDFSDHPATELMAQHLRGMVEETPADMAALVDTIEREDDDKNH